MGNVTQMASHCDDVELGGSQQKTLSEWKEEKENTAPLAENNQASM